MSPAIHPAIPVYQGHWLFKSAFQIQKNPVLFFEEKRKMLGDTFYAAYPGGKVLISAHPGLIKHVLQTNHKNYPKDRGYDQLALMLGQGLVTSKGSMWKKQRKIAQPTFHKRNLENLFLSMTDIASQYLKELTQKKGQIVDISQEMMAVTARIAMKALFSSDIEGNLKEIYHAISYAQEFVAKRAINPLIIPWTRINGSLRKFHRHRDVMDGLINNLIETRQQETSAKSDFLQMLLEARYEDTGEPMPLDLLRDELVTIFSAGHETSANGLAWTLYLLSQHPNIVQRLKEEIQQVLGNRLPSFADLKQMPYTRQVIEEGMRLYPPVWGVGRYAKAADQWGEHHIAANTIVICQIFSLHRHPDLWQDPDTFDPDRFEVEKTKARPSTHYLPFGAGPRMCIGNHFAMMEMQLLLPLLVRHFDFELIKDHQVILEPMITLRPKNGIMMRIK